MVPCVFYESPNSALTAPRLFFIVTMYCSSPVKTPVLLTKATLDVYIVNDNSWCLWCWPITKGRSLKRLLDKWLNFCWRYLTKPRLPLASVFCVAFQFISCHRQLGRSCFGCCRNFIQVYILVWLYLSLFLTQTKVQHMLFFSFFSSTVYFFPSYIELLFLKLYGLLSPDYLVGTS